MNKLTITVNTHLLDKTKLVDRDYTNKEGKEIMVKELKLDAIPLKEKKVIKTGEGWKMLKVGFVKQSATKEERTAKKELPIIGDVIEFENVEEKVNPEDIPF